MAFNVYASTQSSNSEKKGDVDWESVNKYTVETAQLSEKETLVGYVSGIVDLGIQSQEDAQYVSDVALEDEADYIDDNPGSYFIDGIDQQTKKAARMKCVPQRDQQAVVLCVDFPDIIIDKGQFFGESNPKPLRLWMGGQFFTKNNGMIVGKSTALKVTNLDKTRKTKKWSFAKNHLFYKMAIAAKLIKDDQVFLPNDIDKLLGQAFQFSAQVFFKEGKDGKSYYNEHINFVGALGRGQSAPELATTPILIQFNEKNPDEAIKELRNHVINTMKMAKNWEGSLIQKQIESLKGNNSQGDDKQEDAQPEKEQPPKNVPPKKESKPKVEESSPEFDDLDDDIPF